MSKTGLSAITAVVLIAVSIALMAGRWWVLGTEIDGPAGLSSWKITLKIKGVRTAREASLTVLLPPNYRRQQISEEVFESEELKSKVRKSKGANPRRVVWKSRQAGGGPRPFEAVYSFRCVLGMRRPTNAMTHRTHILDGPPAEGRALKPGMLIESDHEDIANLAESLTLGKREIDQVTALFNHVSGLGSDEPSMRSVGALTCLHQGSGDSLAKSRLLVAMCRNRGMPARLVNGLILAGDGNQKIHYWAEAWVENHWLSMCPTHHYFGARRRIPDNYLVLAVGEGDLIRAKGIRFQDSFTARDLHNSPDPEGGPPPSAMKVFWWKLSLSNLRPEEQTWVKFLLLLPPAALIVSLFRTMIGLTTFGTFGPALLGLVCRDLRDLPWGMAIFLLILLLGWGIRRFLDFYHLLLVPRISIVLTVIVLFLIAASLVASEYGMTIRTYVVLLPLIILTHMVERFWTVEVEDGTAASFKTLLGTMVVAVVIGLALSPEIVSTTLFRHPELLGLVLAVQFLVGRYTGYRLTELFRFQDLLVEEPQLGGDHGLAEPHPSPASEGGPGDQPPQPPMHPGPQPARPLSPS